VLLRNSDHTFVFAVGAHFRGVGVAPAGRAQKKQKGLRG